MKSITLSTADLITLTRWVMTPVLWYSIAHAQWESALVWWMAIWLTDIIDGPVARAQQTVSVQGALLDTLIDKIVVLSMCIVLPVNRALCVLIWSKELVQGVLLMVATVRGRIIRPVSLPIGKITMIGMWVYLTLLMGMQAGWLLSVAYIMAWMPYLIVVGYIGSLVTYMRVWFYE